MTIPTRVSAGVFVVSVLMLAGQPAHLRAGDIVVDDPGRMERTLAITCGGHDGTISISSGVRVTENALPTSAGDRPDVQITVGYSNGISVAYNGTRCAECKWLVFAWRELFATYTGRGELRQAGVATTPNGSYKLTENPARPNYHVDSASSIDPYYEAGGNTNLRTPTSTTIFDQPSPRTSVDQKNPDTSELRSVGHYTAYLVCSGRICGKAFYSVTHRWTPSASGGSWGSGVYQFPQPQAPGTLSQGEKAAFVSQYAGHALPR
jgi:hypothetical protein